MCLLHGFQTSNNVFHGTCHVRQQKGLPTLTILLNLKELRILMQYSMILKQDIGL